MNPRIASDPSLPRKKRRPKIAKPKASPKAATAAKATPKGQQGPKQKQTTEAQPKKRRRANSIFSPIVQVWSGSFLIMLSLFALTRAPNALLNPVHPRLHSRHSQPCTRLRRPPPLCCRWFSSALLVATPTVRCCTGARRYARPKQHAPVPSCPPALPRTSVQVRTMASFDNCHHKMLRRMSVHLKQIPKVGYTANILVCVLLACGSEFNCCSFIFFRKSHQQPHSYDCFAGGADACWHRRWVGERVEDVQL